ncbi:zinc finger protein 37-like [Limulus polyphemus]|uniref:Zinc finger protein 37-like n=1 Tax=Limulus polyphemus TaxID=6850 RepID=A0ABM1SWP4_LIMPO|nr:zinc finger protein 37-like [Limulus polyphemus]XP_022248051.1 zinc finger protein 37-like [Limulus polyphemus]
MFKCKEKRIASEPLLRPDLAQSQHSLHFSVNGMEVDKKTPSPHCSSSSVITFPDLSSVSMADQMRDLASIIKAPSLESTSKYIDFESKREDERNEKIQTCISYKYQRDFSDNCKNLKVEKTYPFSKNSSHFMFESKPFYHDLIDTLSGPSEDRKMQKLPPVSTILQPHMAYYSREMYKPFQFDLVQEVPFQENADVSLVCESPFLYCNHQETQSFVSHSLTEHQKAVVKSSPMDNSFFGVLPASTSDFGLEKQQAVQAAHAFTEMPHSFFKHQGLSTAMTNTRNIKSESGMFYHTDSKHSTANDESILVLPSTNPLLTPLNFGTTTYTSSTPPHAFQSTELHHCDSHSQRKCVISSNLSTRAALNSLHSVESVRPCASADTLAASVSVAATETVPNHSFMKTVDMPSEMPNLHCSRSISSNSPFSKLCEVVSKESTDIGLKSSGSVPITTTRCSVLSSIKEEPLDMEVSSHGTFSDENSLQPPAVAPLPSMMTFFKRKNTTESGSELQVLPPFYTLSGYTTLKKQDKFETPENTGSTLERLSLKKEISANIRKSADIFSPSSMSVVSTSRHGTLADSNSHSCVSLNCVKCEVVSSPTQTVSTTLPVSKPPSASIDKMRPCVSPMGCEISVHEDSKLSEKYCLLCQSGKPCDVHILRSPVTSTSHLESPVLSTSPLKPFRCNLCGKNLATKNVYQSHMRSHSGDKPFTCELCGHSFSQKTSLTRHMRSHTGERPFPCDLCGKCFADKERIKIHMRTHTGEKPFACSVCGKCFSQKSTVKRHMSVHTGEKPFICQSCGKGFANRGNLNAHSKTHSIT